MGSLVPNCAAISSATTESLLPLPPSPMAVRSLHLSQEGSNSTSGGCRLVLIKSPGLPILAKHMPILGQQRLGNVAACQRISQWLKTCFYAATPSLAGIGRTAMRGKSVKQQHIAWMGREDILAAQHIRAHLPPGWIDLQLKWQQCLARFFPYPQVLRRWVECRRMKLYSPHNREVIQA